MKTNILILGLMLVSAQAAAEEMAVQKLLPACASFAPSSVVKAEMEKSVLAAQTALLKKFTKAPLAYPQTGKISDVFKMHLPDPAFELHARETAFDRDLTSCGQNGHWTVPAKDSYVIETRSGSNDGDMGVELMASCASSPEPSATPVPPAIVQRTWATGKQLVTCQWRPVAGMEASKATGGKKVFLAAEFCVRTSYDSVISGNFSRKTYYHLPASCHDDSKPVSSEKVDAGGLAKTGTDGAAGTGDIAGGVSGKTKAN